MQLVPTISLLGRADAKVLTVSGKIIAAFPLQAFASSFRWLPFPFPPGRKFVSSLVGPTHVPKERLLLLVPLEAAKDWSITSPYKLNFIFHRFATGWAGKRCASVVWPTRARCLLALAAVAYEPFLFFYDSLQLRNDTIIKHVSHCGFRSRWM